MYNEDDVQRIKSINKKLNSLFTIIQRHGSITKALEDEDEGQPAILMLLVATAEQFNKLYKKKSNILENFDELDIKGIISVRNFIAHDYDGINLSIIEDSLRYGIPEIFEVTKKILEGN
jgi:uncharacterized protein with HEPN domain